MGKMGLEGLAPMTYPQADQSSRHKVYPGTMLRDVVIERPNQVWSSDITYIPMRDCIELSFGCRDGLVQPLSFCRWRLSELSMDVEFCIDGS